MKYKIAVDAAADLDDIWEHIAKDSLDLADRVLQEIYDAVLLLAREPGLGHARTDLTGHSDLRFWPVQNYLILYRVREHLEIVAFARGTRHIPKLLQARNL